MILIIKHIPIEGPGSLGTFLQNNACNIKILELGIEYSSDAPGPWYESLPEELSGIEAIITLGGPMNVYEEDRYPFLKDEDILLKKALQKEVPILGVCLGAQLLAKSCGAKVKKADKKEIGWYRVNLTEEAGEDELFKGLPEELEVFQWHEDTFDIPKGACLLATSDGCRNQAFRFGKNAYGLQFHIEVTDREIMDWARAYKMPDGPAKKMLKDYYRLRETFNKDADIIYNNFLALKSRERAKA